ncbi:hypothetical protein PCLA_01r1042 [Pseudomonas citronellolis]|nr:hypothetical protein PCLA_01r1042 [Pseudomonas citronellolis]
MGSGTHRATSFSVKKDFGWSLGGAGVLASSRAVKLSGELVSAFIHSGRV